MRFSIASALLLPSAIAASFLDAIFVDTPGSATVTAASSVETGYLARTGQASAAQDVGSDQPTPTAQARIGAPHGFMPRAYNPNPGPQLIAEAPIHREVQERQVVPPVAPPVAPPVPLPEPGVANDPAAGVAVTAAADAGPAQYPTVTIQWLPENIKGIPHSATYVPHTYTQTFAKVPEQWPSPGVGRIGYGDDNDKVKRDDLEEAKHKRVAEEKLAREAGVVLQESKPLEEVKLVPVEVEIREIDANHMVFVPRKVLDVEQKERSAGRKAAPVGAVVGLIGLISTLCML